MAIWGIELTGKQLVLNLGLLLTSFTMCMPTIISVTLMSTVYLIQHLCFNNIVFTSLLCLLGLPLTLLELDTWIFCPMLYLAQLFSFLFRNLLLVTLVTFVCIYRLIVSFGFICYFYLVPLTTMLCYVSS